MAKPLVLITGATGFIGSRTALCALQAGYAVRATIRKHTQEPKFKNAPKFQPYLQDLSFALVTDMTAPGAYDAAVEGAKFIIHVASPTPPNVETERLTRAGKSWKEIYYDPAIKGTLELLKAASGAPVMKRIVITASGNVLASIMYEPGAKPTDIRTCPSMDEAEAVQIPGQAYKMSKILAITAARDFVRQQKPKFDIVTVCPGYVQGAYVLAENAEELFATTSRATLDIAMGRSLGGPPLAPNVMGQIWVGDVANAHVHSLTSPDIESDEVLVLARSGQNKDPWEEVGRLLREWFPKEVEEGILRPATSQASMPLNLDSTSTERKLGWEFGGPEVWARETVEQYLELMEKEKKGME